MNADRLKALEDDRVPRDPAFGWAANRRPDTRSSPGSATIGGAARLIKRIVSVDTRSFGLLILCSIFLLVGCAAIVPTVVFERYAFERRIMNIPFRIVLYAPNRDSAIAAKDAAFARIEELDGILSDYDYDSELSRLSRSSGQGAAVEVCDDLWTVLERGYQLAERSDGAFDMTVGPYAILWRKARRDRALPDPTRLADARARVGWQHVVLDPDRQTVMLLVPMMRLDLGGIAKGYAIDEAMETLREHGVTRALVSGGGDMRLGDPPPDRKGWRVEIAPLDVTNAPPAAFVEAQGCGIATSGDGFQRLEIGGVRYSHIVDPHTGLGLVDHSLVTVIGPDCATADSLATTVSVLGPERGIQLVTQTPEVEVQIIRKPEEKIETLRSKGFDRFLVEVNELPTRPAQITGEVPR